MKFSTFNTLVPKASEKDILDALEAAKGDTNAAADYLLNTQPGRVHTENTSGILDAPEADKGDTNGAVHSLPNTQPGSTSTSIDADQHAAIASVPRPAGI